MKKSIVVIASLVTLVGFYVTFNEHRKSIKESTLVTLETRTKIISRYLNALVSSVTSLGNTAKLAYSAHKPVVKVDRIAPYFKHHPKFGVYTLDITEVLEPMDGVLYGTYSILDEVPLESLSKSKDLDVIRLLLPHIGTLAADPAVEWGYVISKDRFVYIVPQVDVEAFAVSEAIYSSGMWLSMNQDLNPERESKLFPPYTDAAGKGLIYTIASPIYDEDVFRGIVAIDIKANGLIEILSIGLDIGRSAIVGRDNNVLTSQGELLKIAGISDKLIENLGARFYEDEHGYQISHTLLEGDLFINHSVTYSELNQEAVIESLPDWGVWLVVYTLLLTAYFKHRTANKNHDLMIKDSLTGVLNRRGLLLESTSVLEQLEKSGRCFAVMIADLDFFKRVNDEHGHDVGDSVIQNTAKQLQLSLREDSILARWGGEEFLIIIPKIEKEEVALQIAERLRKQIEGMVFPELEKSITISIGGTTERKASRLHEAIKRADICLYQAKEGGRNQVRFIQEPDGAMPK